MRAAVERLGPDLDDLPDGETGERRNWVISMIESFRKHPDLRLAKEGGWSDYDRLPRLAVRPGPPVLRRVARPRPPRPCSRRCPSLRRSDGGGRPGRPAFQDGIPGDIDLAMFTFGPAGRAAPRAPVHRGACPRCTRSTASRARRAVPDRGPGRAGAADAGPRRGPAGAGGGAGPADHRAGRRRAPAGARFGVHLCLGDMNHRPLGRAADAAPLVALANAVAGRWPAGRPLHFVHLPLAAADDPPSLDPAYYAPLAGLRLGRGHRRSWPASPTRTRTRRISSGSGG